jgi:hypothetical protein
VTDYDKFFLLSADTMCATPLPWRSFTWSLVSGQKDIRIASPLTPSTIVYIPYVQPDKYRFSILVTEGEYSFVDTLELTTIKKMPFTVLYPAKFDTLFIGETSTIRWQIDPPEGVIVKLSTNGGRSFKTLNENAAVIGDNVIVQWPVVLDSSITPGNQNVLKISSYTNASKSVLTTVPFVVAARQMPIKNSGTYATALQSNRFLFRHSVFTIRSNKSPQCFSLSGKKLPLHSPQGGVYTTQATPGLYLIVSRPMITKVPVIQSNP